MRDKCLNAKAVLHFKRKMKEKIFKKLQVYRVMSKRKLHLANQADYFNRIRLEYNAFEQWLRALKKQMDEKHVHGMAIRHWAWQLEKKCFLNWIMYVNERRAKKERYAIAINDRQMAILKTSLQSLVAYSMDSKERRSKHNLQFKQQNLLNLNQLAFKYFFIWKEKCLKLSGLKTKINSLTAKTECTKMKPAQFTNTPSFCVTNRPQPRKPSFLLESLAKDSMKSIENLKTPETSPINTKPAADEVNIKSTAAGILPDSSSFAIKNLYDSSLKPILMPPSAFTAILSDSSNLNKIASRCSSVSTVTSGLNDEMVCLTNQQNTTNENFKKDLDLLIIKQRMENMAGIKQKLK